MATLNALTVGNAAAPTGQWTSATNGALGDNSDATFGTVENNTTGTYDQGWELDGVNNDLASMNTLAVVLRYRWTATPTGLTTWDSLACRVMSGATVLAAADSGGAFQTVASTITTTTITNSSSTGFPYVNTGATKAQWDAAVVEIRISQTKTKGGDTTPRAIYEADFTGTYTVGATTQTGSFVADAIKKRIGLAGSFVADAIARGPQPGSFTADAYIPTTVAGSVTADAVVARAQAGSFSADAIIEQAQAGSVTADAIVAGTIAGSFTADAYIPGEGLAAAIWVSPADTSTIGAYPVLVFTTPTGGTHPYHFNMQLDKVATFDGGDLRDLKTNVDVTGWEYFDGGGWQPLPATGMPIAYAGNDARYTVQTPLTTGTWYRRVRAGA